ncbi:MAG: sulfite exporter TauE/SafE family protein [Clostridiales bacterium]|jgi:sulfite exporter TauE/SafE/copper chaperone CopZ|nr:sulfite exporter TauE/SafE family protein [Clostridiales bacterium]
MLKTVTLRIGGMTCAGCADRIRKKISPLVVSAKVSFSEETAEITFDESETSLERVNGEIEKLGYTTAKDSNASRALGSLIIILALYLICDKFGVFKAFTNFTTARSGMSFAMVFVIGLLTSAHCAAMCGGINIAVTAKGQGRIRPSLLYNLGRLVSYTAIGGVVGALGSVVSFSFKARGALQIAAGVFMVLMGLQMLGVFRALRRFNLRLPASLGQKIAKIAPKSPFYVGLLGGLMPCGPLQSMQLYALSTGSALTGAFSMFLFACGTIPLMFFIGAISSILSAGRRRAAVLRVMAALVAVLGMAMFGNGVSLAGGRVLPAGKPAAVRPRLNTGGAASASAKIEDGVQIISTTLGRASYPKITVAAGIPVKWTINAPDGSINGCNNSMYIPEYDLEYSFETGENVIQFTPDKAGTFPYSCWMGMIRSTITVTNS